MIEGDEIDIHRIEHEFHAHQHRHESPTGQEAKETDGEKRPSVHFELKFIYFLYKYIFTF